MAFDDGQLSSSVPRIRLVRMKHGILIEVRKPFLQADVVHSIVQESKTKTFLYDLASCGKQSFSFGSRDLLASQGITERIHG